MNQLDYNPNHVKPFMGWFNFSNTNKQINPQDSNQVKYQKVYVKGDQGLMGIPGVKGDQGEKGEKGERGEQGEPGIFMTKTYHFGINKEQVVGCDNIVNLDTTYISNGVSLIINQDGEFTINEGGVYMCQIKGEYSIEKDEQIYLDLVLSSDNQQHLITSIGYDYPNVLNDMLFMQVSNGEKFKLTNITGKRSDSPSNVIFGTNIPLIFSIVKIS